MPYPLHITTIGSMTFDLFLKPQELTVMRFCRQEKSGEEYMALPYGGKVAVKEVQERYGGGAHNTAVGLTRLGLSATPIGAIGNDSWGEKILENLQHEKISAQYLEKTAVPTGFSVILNSFEGERTVLAHAGANAECGDLDLHILESSDGLFFNHLTAEGDGGEQIFLKIKRHFLQFPEKFLAWNPGKEQLRQGAMAFADFFPVVDLLLLNKEEAELFTGTPAQKRASNHPGAFPPDAADYSAIFRIFRKQGARAIVITDGQRGAQLCAEEEVYFCGIDETQARVDTLGAGDAFGSALFYGIITEKELPFALKCASINAASVVAAIGAQPGLLHETDLISRAQNTSLTQGMVPFSLS